MVECFPDAEEVEGSIPSAPTIVLEYKNLKALKIGHEMATEVERKLKALINSLDKKPLNPGLLETSNPLPNEVRLMLGVSIQEET